jgi:hypothetical protein
MPRKAKPSPARSRAGDPKEKTRVIYLNLSVDVAALLEAEARAEQRPISVQAGRIIKQYFENKAKT